MSDDVENEVMEEIEEGTEQDSEEVEVHAETEEQLEGEIEDALKNGATKEEVRSMIEEFHLKVNGKDYVKTIDLNDKEAIKKELQMAMAGRHSMQEAAELRKVLSQDIERLKSDPFSVLAELGLDSDEIAYQHLERKLEQSKKDPAELEKEQMQQELEKAYKELEEQREKARAQEEQRMYQEAAASLENEILEALDDNPDLPSTPAVMTEIGKTMKWAISQGFKDVTVKDVIPTVKSKLQRDLSTLFDKLPEDAFEKYISKQKLDAYRNKRVQEIKKAPKTSPIQSKVKAQSNQKKETPAKKRVSMEDFLRM